MINLSDDIKYQINFLRNSHEVPGCGEIHNHSYNNFDERFDNALNKFDKILLLNKHEVFFTQKYLDDLNNKISKYPNKEIYISCASSTSFYNSLNPLVSLFQWKDVTTRKYINWDSEQILLFDKNNFINIDNNRKIKGIISVRKQEPFHRDYIFNRLNPADFDGVFRYAKWHPNSHTETYDYANNNYHKFPTLPQIIDEYKESYIAFVVESYMYEVMNPLTEKTLIPFLTKTMPVIYGGKNYIKELSDMGFYVFNDLFNDFQSDKLPINSNVRKNNFISCIEYYNTLSFSNIETMYLTNIDKINHNYELANHFIFGNHGNHYKNLI